MSGMAGSSVRFGISPDYDFQGSGVRVGSVSDNSPAARAGFRQGDVITAWNTTSVTGLDDWMPLLRAAKPGDEVTVTFQRDGATQTAKVVLVARGQGT
jgi:putative serine protease PepD